MVGSPPESFVIEAGTDDHIESIRKDGAMGVSLSGCDRASAKDFREIREVFILRVAAVPPCNRSATIEKATPFS